MNEEEYQRWWMAYEPKTPNTDCCPKCGEDVHHPDDPSMTPWGLGIVVCANCNNQYSHVDRWVRNGLKESELSIPDKYHHRYEDIDDPDELWSEDQDDVTPHPLSLPDANWGNTE